MKKFLTLFLATALFLSMESIAQKTWTGTTSTAWNVSTNWSPSGIPASTDNVIIPSAPTNQPLISGTTGVCKDLTVNSGATLTISGTSTNNASLTASGSATINGALSIGGSVSKTGKLIVVNITWGSTSSMSGYLNGSIEVSGNWEFSTGSAVDMGYCGVSFTGSTNSNIVSKSSSSAFSSVTNNKNSGYYVYISATSTSTLKINGSLILNAGTKLYGEAGITTILGSSITNSGNFYFNAGTVSMEKTSGTQTIQINSGDYFNSLKINGGSTVTLNNNVYIHDDLTIQSGTFDPANYTVYVTGDWINTAGPDYFIEGTGRVVFNVLIMKSMSAFDNNCNYSENFNILELNNEGGYLVINSASAVVNCNQYDYTAGGINVKAGTFTALDLADTGIYGYWGLETGGTINLTNTGSYVDLSGNLNITGGNFNVYGGLDNSYWPYTNNASITMSGGILDFVDKGINISASTLTLTSNITGGTIRTSGGFTNTRSDFAPSGGTIELYGSGDVNLAIGSGVLKNLKINKGTSNTVTLTTNGSLSGGLTVESGTLKATTKVLATGDHININNGGTLWFENGGGMMITGGKALTVNSGGTLKVIGISGTPSVITRNGSTTYHEFHVYGTLSARYATFEYNYGINLFNSSTIDPANPLDNCTFQYGTDRFMMIANSQVVTIRNANFPTPPLYENVWKSNDAGRITFKDATGAYAGAAYEKDPYDRVDWVASQPGLWTGLVSTNWFTAGNWDDLTVPVSTTDVTIPTGAPNMPVLSSGSPVCNSLTVTGTLTIRAVTMQVNSFMVVNGTLVMNNASGILNVLGNISWNSLSTASITAAATINAYGNWTFNVGSNAQLGNGTVYFKGSSNKTITCLSASCSFWNLTTNKTGLAITEFSDVSTQPLYINGSFTTVINSKFVSSCGLSIHIKGNISSSGIMQCDVGRLSLDGGSQIITPNTNDYFYHLDFNQTGTVTISNTYTNILNVKGGITIYSGVFDAGSNIIKIGSSYNCSAGAGAFLEGTSRVIFNGLGSQNIYSDENFNILEVNKASGELLINGHTVNCNVYDWTAGLIFTANSGVFTANDLADNGLLGGYRLQSGSTMNLHQDIYQNVDLGGDLEITGGSTINVFGGNGSSQWPYGGNASIYMVDGTLDFKDAGININSMGSNTLTTDITGGTIRTAGLFFCNRADFHPAGGTVELYGPNDVSLDCPAGSLRNLKINKTVTAAPLSTTVTIGSTITVEGILTVESGTLKATDKVLTTGDHININNGGTLWLENASQLKITGNKALTVSSGGTLKAIGTSASKPVITRNGSTPNYEFQVNGTISAKYAIFEYNYGINIWSSAIIDPAYPLDQCTFQNGIDRFLLIANDQVVTIRDANFPTAPLAENVWKNNDAGRVTFRDATGAYAGAAHEKDPYNRVDWIVTQPGLWTGAISTDWHTAGNWDDLNVPIASTNVTIPTGAPNMPLVSAAQAYCHNLTLNGTLTIQARTLNVSGHANIYGTLAMNHSIGILEIQENISWESGSTANISANANMFIYGSWSFNEGSNVQLNNGSVSFRGTSYQSIVAYSPNSSFNDLYIENTGTGNVTFNEFSPSPLRTKGFYVSPGAHFISDAGPNIIVNGNFYSFAATEINTSTVVFAGVDQLIIPHPAAYFNDVIFNQTGTITINQTNTDIMTVHGNITINSGIFSPGSSTVKIGKHWFNWVGPDAFDEGTSRVVFCGTGGQICTTEQFNILEIDKPTGEFWSNQSGSVISCQLYDWTQGGINIAGASSFYAADLADNGIYGNYTIWEGMNSIELHQDASQSVDLMGNLDLSGGEFKVYGGNGQSHWGYYGNASLKMSAPWGYCTLDFIDQTIVIMDVAPYSFTSNISGGTIRTKDGFFAQSPGFNPTAGTVEIYGDHNNSIATEFGGAFYNVTINKSDNLTRTTVLPTLVKNNFTVSEGMAEVPFGWTLECHGNIAVDQGGLLAVTSGTVKMGNLSSININSGGTLYTEAYEGAPSIFTSIYPSAYYDFNVNAGASITVYHTVFENIGEQGLYIAPGANVSTWKTFQNCEFRNGKSGANALLTIDNDQELVIENAIFPANTWSGTYNVRKSVDAGDVTFLNATGTFAGETYDDDTYNHIQWITLAAKTLNLKVYLEGLYAGAGLMNKAQDASGDHFPGNIADVVTVELHGGSPPYSVSYTFNNVDLNTDGAISIPTVPLSVNGQYYIVIKHRNSIETWSSAPFSFAGYEPFFYDFSTTASNAFGNNLKQVGTVYTIWGGDVNQDGIVDGVDMSAIYNTSQPPSLTGYNPQDVNGDGIVDGVDMSMVYNNSQPPAVQAIHP